MAIFHLLGADEWRAAQAAEVYSPPSLEREGFIHFSGDHQLLRSAERYFAGRDDVVVISVREDRLRAELRHDLVEGVPFPHLYGPLNLDAVVESHDLRRGPDGRFVLPEAWIPWRAFFVRGA